MLRKLVGIAVFFLLIMTSVPMSMGCVGRVLFVGALSSSADRLMSELLAILSLTNVLEPTCKYVFLTTVINSIMQ
jgi:hypothetical protein